MSWDERQCVGAGGHTSVPGITCDGTRRAEVKCGLERAIAQRDTGILLDAVFGDLEQPTNHSAEDGDGRAQVPPA